MDGYVIDTSIFVAAEQDRPLGAPPAGDGRTSVATLTELGVGVRRAVGEEAVQRRRATMEDARRYIALAYDEPVAERLADVLAAARDQRRRAGLMDAIIAATALAHDLTGVDPGRRLRRPGRAGAGPAGAPGLRRRGQTGVISS